MKGQSKRVIITATTGFLILISVFLPWFSIDMGGSMEFGDLGGFASKVETKLSANGMQQGLEIYGLIFIAIGIMTVIFAFVNIKIKQIILLALGGVGLLLGILLFLHKIGVNTGYANDFDMSIMGSSTSIGIDLSNGIGLYLLLIAFIFLIIINIKFKKKESIEQAAYHPLFSPDPVKQTGNDDLSTISKLEQQNEKLMKIIEKLTDKGS